MLGVRDGLAQSSRRWRVVEGQVVLGRRGRGRFAPLGRIVERGQLDKLHACPQDRRVRGMSILVCCPGWVGRADLFVRAVFPGLVGSIEAQSVPGATTVRTRPDRCTQRNYGPSEDSPDACFGGPRRSWRGGGRRRRRMRRTAHEAGAVPGRARRSLCRRAPRLQRTQSIKAAHVLRVGVRGYRGFDICRRPASRLGPEPPHTRRGGRPPATAGGMRGGGAVPHPDRVQLLSVRNSGGLVSGNQQRKEEEQERV